MNCYNAVSQECNTFTVVVKIAICTAFKEQVIVSAQPQKMNQFRKQTILTKREGGWVLKYTHYSGASHTAIKNANNSNDRVSNKSAARAQNNKTDM